MIVKLITKEALVELRREARRQRKERSERMLNTTMRDVSEMLRRDLSSFPAGRAQSGIRQESKCAGSELPELPSGYKIGQYEDELGVRLVVFARDAASPVLTNFGSRPSKRFEENVRHSAKVRACRLHFYRLSDDYVAIEVEPKETPSEVDARFLRSVGINAM